MEELLANVKYRYIGVNPAQIHYVFTEPTEGTTLTLLKRGENPVIFTHDGHDFVLSNSTKTAYEFFENYVECDDETQIEYDKFSLSVTQAIEQDYQNDFEEVYPQVYFPRIDSGIGHELSNNINSVHNVRNGFIEAFTAQLGSLQLTGGRITQIMTSREIPVFQSISFSGVTQIEIIFEKSYSNDMRLLFRLYSNGEPTDHIIFDDIGENEVRFSSKLNISRILSTPSANLAITFNVSNHIIVDQDGVHPLIEDVDIYGTTYPLYEITDNFDQHIGNFIEFLEQETEELRHDISLVRQTFITR